MWHPLFRQWQSSYQLSIRTKYNIGKDLRDQRAEQLVAGGAKRALRAEWTEVPTASDATNLDFVRNVVGKSRIASGAIVCRTSNSFPIADGFRALPVTELE